MPERDRRSPPPTRWCRASRACAAARRDAPDVWTLEIELEDGAGSPSRPGQFNMLSAFGVGEAAISISGDPAEPEPPGPHDPRGRPGLDAR